MRVQECLSVSWSKSVRVRMIASVKHLPSSLSLSHVLSPLILFPVSSIGVYQETISHPALVIFPFSVFSLSRQVCVFNLSTFSSHSVLLIKVMFLLFFCVCVHQYSSFSFFLLLSSSFVCWCVCKCVCVSNCVNLDFLSLELSHYVESTIKLMKLLHNYFQKAIPIMNHRFHCRWPMAGLSFVPCSP